MSRDDSGNDNPLFGDDDDVSGGNEDLIVTGADPTAPRPPASSNNNNNNSTNLMASLLSSSNDNIRGGGAGGSGNDVDGGGLFGEDADDEDDDGNDPPPFATTTRNDDNNNNNNNNNTAPTQGVTPPTNSTAPVHTTTTTTTTTPTTNPVPSSSASSLLMRSGLLSGVSANTTNQTGVATTTNTTTDDDDDDDNHNNSNDNDLFGVGGGGGGLFDEVDQQEEREKQNAAERLRQEAEEGAARQKQQEDLLRQQDLQQQQQQNQQQQQQQQQEQQNQLTDQMQSVYLGNTVAPPEQQQQQQPHPYGGMMAQSMPSSPPPAPSYMNANNHNHAPYGSATTTAAPYGQGAHQSPMIAHSMMAAAPTGFYRDHGNLQQHHPSSPYGPQQISHNNNNNNNNNNSMMGGADFNQNRYYQPPQTPSVLAGMHNGPPAQQLSLGRPPMSLKVQEPPPVPTFYASVRVSEPLLIPGQALFGNAPHWSYQVATTLQPQNGTATNGIVWLVRRRFRHVVALEERLREECPGAVLAPRPDKHATRALEEASTQQSAEFALQRCNELQAYLNQLIKHPYAYATHTLRLFLSLQDDLGTAWPECSNNTFTRLANAGVGAAVKVSEQTQATKFPWQDPLGHIDDYGEEDAELLALASAEQVRMGAVLQAIPKVEGAITLLREGAELKGSTGMELSRMAKEVEITDKELSYPVELVAGGMLRSGRRSKRMALELAAALETFMHQYKLCRYEKIAFQDRRVAIMRRNKERGKADQRAHQLMMQQQRQMYAQQPPYGGNPYGVHAMQNQAINADTMASDSVQECNEIGRRIKSEVNRISWHRRQEWKAAVKVVASANKEAVSENIAIWESVRESFLQAFPE